MNLAFSHRLKVADITDQTEQTKQPEQPEQPEQSALSLYLDRRVIAMLFLGFSAGIPILLIFSTLGIWLREAGLDRSTITMFSWAALGYSFKFVWAPLIDRLPVPVLTRWLGQRRAWIITAQFAIITAILWMGSINPASDESGLVTIAFAAVLLGFSSATQDIVIDAYRIEIADSKLQALLSATYIAGYRIGMLFAGAGALFIADILGSSMADYSYQAWRLAYYAMAGVMLIGVVTTLLVAEPDRQRVTPVNDETKDYLGFFVFFCLAVATFIAVFYLTAGATTSALKAGLKDVIGNKILASVLVETGRLILAVLAVTLVVKAMVASSLLNGKMFVESYVEPVSEFVSRYQISVVILLISLIGLYRISDIVLGVVANVFYIDIGYSKTEIASIVKTFGLLMTIAGGFVGGVLSLRFGVIKTLFLGAVLTILTNLLFVALAKIGYNIPFLYLVISADNLTAGLASAAFIAFLSSLTNVKFTAVQYAIFSSFMTLIPKIIGGYSGTIVDTAGYQTFFIIASLMGVPILGLVWLVGRRPELRGF